MNSFFYILIYFLIRSLTRGDYFQIGPDMWGNADLHDVDHPNMATFKRPGLGHTFACRSGSEGTATCRNEFIPGIEQWNVVTGIARLEVWVAPQ